MRTYLFVLLGLLFMSCAKTEPRSVTFFVHAPPYPRTHCVRSETTGEGSATLPKRGEPIANAEIRFLGSAHAPNSLRTDDKGKVTINLPLGHHELAIDAPGFATESRYRVNIDKAKSFVEITLYPCVSAGDIRKNVGFGQAVALLAEPRCGAEWKGASYRWRQVEGPDIASTVTRWNDAKFVFHTKPLTELKQLPKAPQWLSFSHDEAGEYVFEITSENKKKVRSKSYIMVTSTSVSSGITSVAPFQPYYVVGEEQGPWRWELLKHPKDWDVIFRDTESRTPHLIPRPMRGMDIPQHITIREATSMRIFTLVVGNWNGVPRDCGRSGCHASMETHWKQAKHARSWERLLDGVTLRDPMQLTMGCAECHSLGYDPTVNTGGFDDLMKEHGEALPADLIHGNYSKLHQGIKDVSNVYCLACHGPARVDPPVGEQPGLFGAGVCARCHDQAPEQTIASEWRVSKHANTLSGALNGPEHRDACKNCHTAQGFYYKHATLSRPPTGKAAVLSCCEQPQPITCQACHNPMLAVNKHQLHLYHEVTTESGLELKGVAGAALCASCHNTGHDITAPETVTTRAAPHSPQTELSYGRGGFWFDNTAEPTSIPSAKRSACGAAPPEGCVSCHMASASSRKEKPGVGGHTFRMKSPEGNENVQPCQNCHQGLTTFNPTAKADYDGDAQLEGFRDEVSGLLSTLELQLKQAIRARQYRGCGRNERAIGIWVARGSLGKIVVVDAQGYDLGDCDQSRAIEREENPFVFPEKDLVLHRAAYNYFFIQTDRSSGLHNPPYVIALLKQTIAALTPLVK